ncbi:MAG: UDP-glucose 6-dehydrogenase TuaD [Microgenomates group bacterium GW2011_GWA2_40_6]|nr:MAG: UDP-glucose 6-dehydrogenase TuaD [Microgenomates group bacterium GW2011_GWA2_40_6]
MKKVTVLGVGYVGLVTAACLSDIGHQVTGVDIDKNRIENLKNGIIPIYEPGLEERVKKYFGKSLDFTIEVDKAITESEIVFIAVGTPSMPDGSVNLNYVKGAAETIGKAMNGYKVIVNKSTVPIGTGDMVANIIKKYYSGDFEVVSNPEFLREGTAVADFMNPDRIVIGNGEGKAREIISELYSPLPGERVLTNVKTAEMIKYASNSLLATEISFINSIANICEKVGANVVEVAKGMKLDKRIGKYAFLEAGVGYGGSCFPKDVKALVQIAKDNGIRFDILESTERTNEEQKKSLLPKIKKLLGENLSGKQITVWGVAFKAETDDVREAPALTVIQQLQENGAKVKIFDPVAKESAQKILPDIEFVDDIYESVNESECLVVVTEWKQFKEVDLARIKDLMNKPNVVDGRNLFEVGKMKEMGFNYLSVGR